MRLGSRFGADCLLASKAMSSLSRNRLFGALALLGLADCGGRYTTFDEGAGGGSGPGSGGTLQTGGTGGTGLGGFGTGGSAGTGGGPPTCGKGFSFCNGACTNLINDPFNCGSCGYTCPATDACISGSCQRLCNSPYHSLCGNVCADLDRDLDHCGSCFHACPPNSACVGGTCASLCAPGFEACAQGCMDLQNDWYNCGACGNACALDQTCSAGSCIGGMVFTFSGILQNLPIAMLDGWRLCHSETYGSYGTRIEDVLQTCNRAQLLLGCRVKGSSILSLAAHASRHDVTFDTDHYNQLHVANGVGWYFDPSWSWGFAPANATVNRTSCDIIASDASAGIDGDLRLCWHTGEGLLEGGWRCGRKTQLNGSHEYERVIFDAF